MFSLPISPTLELRHYEWHHVQMLLELILQSRNHLRGHLAFADTADLDSVENFIRRSRENFAKGLVGNFGIWQNDTLVGNIGLFDIKKQHRKAEIGYWIGQPFAGQGIITQAVGKMLDYGFSALNLNRIHLCCATDNHASRRIAEKNGFVLEGLAREDRVLRNSRVSHQIWAMLAEDWQTTSTDFTKPLGDGAELRLLEARHAPEVFAAVDRNRQHLRRFLPWVDDTKTPEDSKQFIQACLEQFRNFDGMNAGIWQDGQLAGLIGMHFVDYTHRDTEFGYWLDEDFVGRGLVTKAATALLDYIFYELNLHRVTIAHALENTTSKRVIERLGFKPEAVIRDAEFLYDRFHNWQRYGLLRREWRG